MSDNNNIYYSLKYSGDDINRLLKKIDESNTLEKYGITNSYTKDETNNLVWDSIEQTLKGDLSTYPSLYVKQKEKSYALVFIDSENNEYELFDFANLNIPRNNSELINDNNYITSTELTTSLAGKANKKRGGWADHIVLSAIDGDINFSNYTISPSYTVITNPSSDSFTAIPTASAVDMAIPLYVDKPFKNGVKNNDGSDSNLTPRLAIDKKNNDFHYILYYMDSNSESHRYDLFDFSKYFPERKNTVSSFNNENNEVLLYMNKENSSESNVNSVLNQRADIPEALTILLPNDLFNIKISYIKIIDCENGFQWEEKIPDNATTYQLKNLIPNRLYRYYILDDNKNIITPYSNGHYDEPISGACISRGQVRMIDGLLDENGRKNLFNIRDIGGWKCQDGVLKYGLIYRGCRLDGSDSDRENSEIELSLSQKKYLTEVLNIEDEIDLRGGQSSRTSSILDQSNSPNEDYNAVVDYQRYVVQYYQNSLRAADAPIYASIIHRIAQNLKNNKVTYIHCSAGADRTAQVCALIEALCGVSRIDIDRDFEITSYSFEYDSSNIQNDCIYINKRNLRQKTDNGWQGFMNFQGSDGTVINGITLQEKATNLLLNYHDNSLSEANIIEDIRIIQNCLIERDKTLTKISELENDKGYLVAADISNKINKLGNGNATIIRATNDGNIERSPYQITTDTSKVSANAPTHNYIPTAKAVGEVINNIISKGTISIDNGALTGKYTIAGDLCILQCKAQILNGETKTTYTLPISPGQDALYSNTIVYKNGIQYLISIEENENNILVLTISRIDGQSYTSDDIIYFTLTYSIT